MNVRLPCGRLKSRDEGDHGYAEDDERHHNFDKGETVVVVVVTHRHLRVACSD
jgi:hypothetical protein